MGESATAFINRAIDEAMKRDLSEQRHIAVYSHFASGKQKNPVTYGYNSTHHRTIFILINFLMSNLQCVLFYINNIMYKASHLIIFVSFFTHFKWSKPGLNSTFPLYRTAEKPSKIKRSKHFIKSLPVYCRGR